MPSRGKSVALTAIWSDAQAEVGVAPTERVETSHFPWYVRLALTGIIANLFLPANLLDNIGIPYDLEGGSLPFKIHPGTYLIFLAFAMFLRRRAECGFPLLDLARRYPSITFYLAVMLASPVYSAAVSGGSGAASYIESYIPGGLIAMMWHEATPRARRTLGYVVLCVCMLDAMIATAENLTQVHLVPLSPYFMIDSYTKKLVDTDSALFINKVGEFRGSAFFDHPLTGATMTMMASFLVIGMHLRPIVRDMALLLLLVGLLSFGGRGALGVTIAALMYLGAVHIFKRGLARTLLPSDVARLIAAVTLVPMVVAFILTSTTIGARIVTHAYIDDSAATRGIEWHVLSLMTLKELLFGASQAHILNYVYILGTSFPFSDIENFMLLAFIGLGAIWFLLFLAALVAFSRWLWLNTSSTGRLMLVGLLVMIMASNSLGRKSNLLTLTVACAIAVGAFSERLEKENDGGRVPNTPLRPPLAPRLLRRPLTTPRR